MKAPIDFYFDFSSPYGYLGSQRIEALAERHGRTVSWKPYLIGAAFKVSGAKPLTEFGPAKRDYAVRDFARSARFYGIAFRMPSTFPVATVAATRAYYWLAGKDPARAVALAKALYKAYFVDDVNISDAENVVRVAASAGCNLEEARAALNDPAVKDKTRAEVEAAIAKGAFGSPYVVADGEPFWGVDRFDQLERWLREPF
jgi:2-hydroxychromene-2-carboxylate isomerase